MRLNLHEKAISLPFSFPSHSHSSLSSDRSKEWHLCTNEIRSASFWMLIFGWKWLVSLFTCFSVTNSQRWLKLRLRVCVPFAPLTKGWEPGLAVSSETPARLWCIEVNIFLTFLRTDFHHWIHLYFWGCVINESGHSFSSPHHCFHWKKMCKRVCRCVQLTYIYFWVTWGCKSLHVCVCVCVCISRPTTPAWPGVRQPGVSVLVTRNRWQH